MVFLLHTSLSYWDNPIRVAFRIRDCRNIFAIYNLKFAILVLLIKKRESGNALLLLQKELVRLFGIYSQFIVSTDDGDNDENSFDL